jgi:hypothetical protein
VRLPLLTVVQRRTSSGISIGGVGLESGENERIEERRGLGVSVREVARCGVSGRIGGE